MSHSTYYRSFLQRDATHGTDNAVTVTRCLSVHLSIRWYSVETVQHITKLFSPSGRHTILQCVPKKWDSRNLV